MNENYLDDKFAAHCHEETEVIMPFRPQMEFLKFGLGLCRYCLLRPLTMSTQYVAMFCVPVLHK